MIFVSFVWDVQMVENIQKRKENKVKQGCVGMRRKGMKMFKIINILKKQNKTTNIHDKLANKLGKQLARKNRI